MKILMPYKVHDGKTIGDAKIMGGLERFAQLLHKTFNKESDYKIVPLEITKQHRERGVATKIILGAAKAKSDAFEWTDDICDIDIILTNYEEDSYTTKLIIPGGPPVVWIYHTGQDGTFGRVKATRLFKQFTDRGGHLYFVSKHQHMMYDELSNRILGHPVENVRGYVNPAFCEGFETVWTGERTHDVVTIGRTSYIKDPFWVHEKLNGTQYTSAVITTGGHHLESSNEKKYYEKNKNWTSPRTVYRDLPHRDGLLEMSKCGVFVSTWPLETWGITALEALSHGVPTILLTDKSGTHASEGIAANPNHIRCLPKNCDRSQLLSVIDELSSFSVEKRLQIASETQNKHSVAQFKKTFVNIFNSV